MILLLLASFSQPRLPWQRTFFTHHFTDHNEISRLLLSQLLRVRTVSGGVFTLNPAVQGCADQAWWWSNRKLAANLIKINLIWCVFSFVMAWRAFALNSQHWRGPIKPSGRFEKISRIHFTVTTFTAALYTCYYLFQTFIWTQRPKAEHTTNEKQSRQEAQRFVIMVLYWPQVNSR